MRKTYGIIGSFVAAMLLFRLAYGAWPPFEGNFWQWLTSDSRAMWALLAGVAGTVVGGIVGQVIEGARIRDLGIAGMGKPQDTLWIIAGRQESITTLCRELADLRSRVFRPFGWCVSADLSQDKQPPLLLAELTGVVMVVDREALFSETFVEVAGGLIGTMGDRDDFCVFPWLCGVSFDEVKELAREKKSQLAVLLVDNVHLDASMESLPKLIETIRSHLDNVETLRAFSRFERFSLGVTRALGKAAARLSWVVVLAALAVSVLMWSHVPAWLALARGVSRDASALLVLAAIPILGFRFHSLFRLLNCGPELLREYPRFWVEFFAVGGAGAVVGLAGASFDMVHGPGTLVVGFGLGIMLVSLERRGYRARMPLLSFAALHGEVASGAIQTHIYDGIAASTVNTGIPLYEPPYKRVFISYARSSPWCSKAADEIAASLRDLGVYVFLDRPSLRPGLPWKRQLRWAIENSNVFIVVLDHDATQRKWIAAEFATAFLNKTVKGTPEIFVVHEDVDFSTAEGPAGSFFAEILLRPSRVIPYRLRSRMASYDAENCARMCDAIRRYPIGGTFGALTNVVAGFMIGPLVSVIGLACHLGVPLLLVYILSIWGIVSPSSLLAAHPEMAVPAAAALALTGGFSLRYAFWTLTEIRRSDYAYASGYLELVEAVAFLAGLGLCIPRLSLNGVCLVVLMVFLGLELASIFTLCMRTWKSQSA